MLSHRDITHLLENHFDVKKLTSSECTKSCFSAQNAREIVDKIEQTWSFGYKSNIVSPAGSCLIRHELLFEKIVGISGRLELCRCMELIATPAGDIKRAVCKRG